ncbi:MAG: tRNA (N(6)-L-threonylcarbamoyladenosine(37)-C(2))-methylthiotransferase MtaB [Lachnospiraceae bacterium]|nr:tRNA (N(6)-L-threonylcarbamoyladenosine(37)-C(2))-methylthiotransferase MtaB [Lachnospiraceae bacterium]
MRKAALHNLGCKVNAYETESMQQLLEQAGYEIVPFEEAADVYVVNTCSVTNIADRKSRQMLHRARRRNPDSVVVAAGCYVQTAKEQAEDAAVDIFIGNNKKHELPQLLEQFFASREAAQEGAADKERNDSLKIAAVSDIGRDSEYETLSVSRTAEHTRAFMKVQDGCNQFCSYCIIPYARGRVRSRQMQDVIQEAKRLSDNGCKEVVLTGIHLSSYGVDLGTDLITLIEKVHDLPRIARIRLGSLEPKIVTEEFAGRLAKLPKLCPHFHLSLQSGCDAVLKRMNRKYTCAEYLQACELLRGCFTHPAITTDVIVGFPGETEEEFQETRRFLKKIGFFEIHIFKYSLRKGTRAAAMEHQIPEQVKNVRSDILFSDLAPMNEAFLDWHLGREAEALLEEQVSFEGKEYFLGHTKEYVKIAVPAEEPGQSLVNRVVRGRITSRLKERVLQMENVLEETS